VRQARSAILARASLLPCSRLAPHVPPQLSPVLHQITALGCTLPCTSSRGELACPVKCSHMTGAALDARVPARSSTRQRIQQCARKLG
jgi:hypothetical protein